MGSLQQTMVDNNLLKRRCQTKSKYYLQYLIDCEMMPIDPDQAVRQCSQKSQSFHPEKKKLNSTMVLH